MKKLVMTLAAGLFATALMAEVKSANVVGYSTLTFKEGWNLIGVQFEAIGAGGGTIDVQDLFTDITLMGLDEEYNPNDYLKVWDNETGFYTENFYWSGDAIEEYQNVWLDGDNNEAAYAFKAGDAFWVYTAIGGSAAGAVTLGQVGATDVPLAIIPAWNLIANPFPVPLVINGGTLAVDGLVGLDEEYNPNDYLKVWDNETGFYTENLYWSGDTIEEYQNVWLDGDNNEADLSIAPNAGFWIYHNGTGAELTFSSPL
jgi:hypothetical protein